MNNYVSKGIIVSGITSIIVAGVVPFTHSPPGQETPHAHQDNYSPSDKGWYVTTVTSTGNTRTNTAITPGTGNLALTGHEPLRS